MLDDFNIVQTEEVVDTLNAGVFSSQVDDKVERHHQQRVAEKPKHLEDGFFPGIACRYKHRI